MTFLSDNPASGHFQAAPFCLSRPGRWGGLAALVVLAACALALGAPPKPAVEPPKPVDLTPLVKVVLTQRLVPLDQEIAERIMKRPSVTADAVARLETGIDLRIIARTVLALAVESPAGSDLQVQACLRANQMLMAIAELEQMQQAGGLAPTRTQSEAMVRLRQWSYGLTEIKTPDQLDAISRKLSLLMLDIASPTPVDPATVPLMRPKAGSQDSSPPGANASDVSPPGLAQLADEIRRLAVSVPLRQQLLALAAQSQAIADDPDQRPEAAALQSMLADAVNLARGLADNTATATEARQEMETRLAEGVALLMDRRMRSVGKLKIASLAGYRQILLSISRLKLSPEQVRLFSPAFVWRRPTPTSSTTS